MGVGLSGMARPGMVIIMQEVRVQLRLLFGQGQMFGPGKADLLELIGQHGSISAAGRAMKMSYKRAWSLVEDMNRAFKVPLVETLRGGAGHGGAKVTEAGQEVLARYRRLQSGLEMGGAAELAAFAEGLADPGETRLPMAQADDMFGQT